MVNRKDTEDDINIRKLYHGSGDLKFIPLFAQKGGRNMKELHYSLYSNSNSHKHHFVTPFFFI